MLSRFLCALLLAGLCAAKEKKPLPPAHAANSVVEVTATPYVGKDAVKEAVGSDLDGEIVVVQVRLVPKGGKPFVINRDDFMLRSDKDGQKSQPFAPTQLAGRSALVVSYEGSGGGVASQPTGPVWGGIGGYPGGGGVGNTAGPDSARATINNGTNQKEDPLLRTLKEKVLPEKTTKEPVSGMLYFLMEGKQKVKDLELLYRTPAGRLSLRFPH